MPEPRMTLNTCLVTTPIGWILIAESALGLCFLDLLGDEKPTESKALEGLRHAFARSQPTSISRMTPLLEQASRAVIAYAEAGKPLPELPLDLNRGTPFDLEVWEALRQIPFGETRSYGWIARELGRPGAARAVGHACGRNPIPLFVPCHRVLASDGGLGGFSAGLALKESLLRLEQTHVQGAAKVGSRDTL